MCTANSKSTSALLIVEWTSVHLITPNLCLKSMHLCCNSKVDKCAPLIVKSASALLIAEWTSALLITPKTPLPLKAATKSQASQRENTLAADSFPVYAQISGYFLHCRLQTVFLRLLLASKVGTAHCNGHIVENEPKCVPLLRVPSSMAANGNGPKQPFRV